MLTSDETQRARRCVQPRAPGRDRPADGRPRGGRRRRRPGLRPSARRPRRADRSAPRAAGAPDLRRHRHAGARARDRRGRGDRPVHGGDRDRFLVASLVGGLRPAWLVGALIASGWVLIAGTYFVLFWSAAGQTPGMRLLRLRVRGPSGESPSTGRSIVQAVGLVLAIVPLFAGFLLCSSPSGDAASRTFSQEPSSSTKTRPPEPNHTVWMMSASERVEDADRSSGRRGMGLLRGRNDEPGGRRFRMREKMVSIGDDFWIEDEDGNRAYKVDGKAMRLRDTILLKDSSGREVAKIQERKLSIRDKMAIERDGEKVATVHKALVGIRDRFAIDVEGGEDLKAKGTSWTTSTRSNETGRRLPGSRSAGSACVTRTGRARAERGRGLAARRSRRTRVAHGQALVATSAPVAEAPSGAVSASSPSAIHRAPGAADEGRRMARRDRRRGRTALELLGVDVTGWLSDLWDQGQSVGRLRRRGDPVPDGADLLRRALVLRHPRRCVPGRGSARADRHRVRRRRGDERVPPGEHRHLRHAADVRRDHRAPRLRARWRPTSCRRSSSRSPAPSSTSTSSSPCPVPSPRTLATSRTTR